MKATNAVKEIMASKNEKPVAFANKLKINNTTLCERLKQENISIVKLEEMLRLLDYKIVFVPRETREQEGWYRVE